MLSVVVAAVLEKAATKSNQLSQLSLLLQFLIYKMMLLSQSLTQSPQIKQLLHVNQMLIQTSL